MERGSLFRTGLLDGDFQPEITAYYFKQWNEMHMAFHRHDSTEIMYIISGVCRVEINSGSAREHDSKVEGVNLKKGEFILIDANVPHRLIVEKESPCRMLNIEFRFSDCKGSHPSLRQYFVDGGEAVAIMASAPFNYIVMRDPEDIYYTLKSLVLELDRIGHEVPPVQSSREGTGRSAALGDPAVGMKYHGRHVQSQGQAMVRLLFAQLLIALGRLRQEHSTSGQLEYDHYVKQCLNYLHENYDQDIRVQDVAKIVNLHPGYLQRIFKNHTGETLMQYLTRLRMDKASMLLLHTDIPVADIADYVGIGSRQYFHALFKKHTGFTPVMYRNSLHAQKNDEELKSEDF
ncbi:AraC family transcriptional regulator [Paenibacillus lentus]|uniref:AraC family transcriptional regulator n=1 Tax=Paenibacillus lentus TaxID=1338368 RepID=A0A3Q8S6A0_9BACL|nr:AraC family transcriptional regulator [Paenibacillus lentus]AZK48401.1 AraC family transcriptional regulator [Paenibacillus lentus]